MAPPSKQDAATMKFFGLTLDDYPERNAELWPDNVPAFNLFVQMGTQWRVSANGAYGLDYGALPAVMRLAGVPRALWNERFEELRICEDSALEMMRKAD